MKTITEILQTLEVGDVCHYVSDIGKAIAMVEEITETEICFRDILQLNFQQAPVWTIDKRDDLQIKILFSTETPKTREELAIEKIKQDYPEMFL